MSAATIHIIAFGLHALGLLAAACFGFMAAREFRDEASEAGLFAFAIILALAGYALQVAA